MGFISETRTSLENPQTPLSFPAEWLLDIFNGGRTDSGIRVSELTALQVATAFCCVELKAGAIATLDLKIFEKVINEKDGRVNRRIAHESDLWDLLCDEPNDEMSSFTMRKTVQAHRMLWGNGYIEIQRDNADRVIALWPRNPARMHVRRASEAMTIRGELVRPGDMFYATTEGAEAMAPVDVEEAMNEGRATERGILPADMLHMPGLALDGRLGQDVVQLARNAFGLALATEKFGGKFFGNGAVGYGIFEFPGTLAPEDLTKWRQELNEAWGGENVNRPLLLDAGMKYTSTSTKPNEGQFLETRMFQITEICRVMGNVPPHMVGVTEKTSRANVEQIGQEFLTFSLSPDLKCWEHEIKRKLFPRPAAGRSARKNFGVFFDTWPLVTPAAADLRAFIQAMVQWGVWQPNDARARLNDNPLPGAASDATWMQINMAPTQQLYETPALPGAGREDDDAADPQSQDPQSQDPAAHPSPKGKRDDLVVARLSRSYCRLFRDAFGRICARSATDLKAFRQVFLPVLVSIGEELEHHATARFQAAPAPDGIEGSRFLASYLETMQHRSQNESWATANGNSDAIAERELVRAIRALAVEAYRNAATAAAKQETEVEA
jgi:HK97 family phage portal protein